MIKGGRNLRPPLKPNDNMTKSKTLVKIPDEIIINKIIVIRDKKVMIDRDLAELYGVTTKRLNEQVKRNPKRFPNDFMFQITKEEKEEIMLQFEHLKGLKFSTVLPYVFTEHGAVMLASVLNSDKAIGVNIQIVRVFTRIREVLLSHKDVLLKIEKLEYKMLQQNHTTNKHDDEIQHIFKILKQLLDPPQEPREPVGFKSTPKKLDK
jgi:ORF6N domain